MRKVFVCELRRLLLNKFFFGILAAVLLYGWVLLSGEVILGVAYTAPFSPWSFGYYLARLLPLLWVGTLFFLTLLHLGGRTADRGADRRDCGGPAPLCGRALHGAAARDASAAWRRRAAGRGILCLYAALDTIGGACCFLCWQSRCSPLVFAAGSGWLLGGACPWLVYGWMLAPFILSALPLPEALGLWNGTLLRSYPLTLPADPPFTLPAAVWVAQGLLLLAGILLLGMRIFRRRQTMNTGKPALRMECGLSALLG